MPYPLQLEFAQEACARGPTPKFVDLLTFVENRARVYNSFYGRLLTRPSRSQFSRSPQRIRQAKSFNVMESTCPIDAPKPTVSKATINVKGKIRSQSAPCCSYCEGDHSIYRCLNFQALEMPKRRQFVKSANLCFNCFGTKHRVGACNSKFCCRSCGKRHHSLLHDERTVSSPEPAVTTTKTNKITAAIDFNSRADKAPIRLMVVPVEIVNPSSRLRKIRTNCFVDFGSTRSYISTNLARRLNLSGPTETISMATANATTSCLGSSVKFAVRGLNESTEIVVSDAYTLESIPDVKEFVVHPEIIYKYDHLAHLEFAKVDSEVELLLGSDVIARYPISESLVGGDDTPTAYHLVIGWALAGPDLLLETPGISRTNSSLDRVLKSSDSTIPLCQYCKNDFPDLLYDPTVSAPSQNDKRAKEIMLNSIRLVDGRFEIALPWVADDLKLDNNRSLAYKRLISMKRKFNKDPGLYQRYCDKIKQLRNDGYCELIPSTELTPSRLTNYLPHHAVGPKFRIVFDCSATNNGFNLNQNLLAGEFHTSSLLGVLIRFRQERVAMTSDITSMFLRIRLRKTDTDAMRFLWYKNDDFSQPIVEYRMLSHVFGATCSPAVATLALHVARLNLSGATPETLSTVNRNFFVDDCLKSVATEEEMRFLITDLRQLLATAGFHLPNSPLIASTY